MILAKSQIKNILFHCLVVIFTQPSMVDQEVDSNFKVGQIYRVAKSTKSVVAATPVLYQWAKLENCPQNPVVIVHRGRYERLRCEPLRVGRAGEPQGAPVPVAAHVVNVCCRGHFQRDMIFIQWTTVLRKLHITYSASQTMRQCIIMYDMTTNPSSHWISVTWLLL